MQQLPLRLRLYAVLGAFGALPLIALPLLGLAAFDIAVLAGCAAAGLGLATWRIRKQFITA